MTGSYDFTLAQGATFDRTLTYKVGGTAVNLTTYGAQMQARQAFESGTAILDLAAGTGITLGGTAGTIRLQLSATQTAALTPGSYVYDLELTVGSAVTRLLEGRLYVTPEVTR